jgi:hypothetical protein
MLDVKHFLYSGCDNQQVAKISYWNDDGTIYAVQQPFAICECYVSEKQCDCFRGNWELGQLGRCQYSSDSEHI